MDWGTLIATLLGTVTGGGITVATGFFTQRWQAAAAAAVETRAEDRAHRERQREAIAQLSARVSTDLAAFDEEWSPVNEDGFTQELAIAATNLRRRMRVWQNKAFGDIARVDDPELRAAAEAFYETRAIYLIRVEADYANHYDGRLVNEGAKAALAATEAFAAANRRALASEFHAMGDGSPLGCGGSFLLMSVSFPVGG